MTHLWKFFEVDLIESSYHSTSPNLLDARDGNAELEWMASLTDTRRTGRKLTRQKKNKGNIYIYPLSIIYSVFQHCVVAR